MEPEDDAPRPVRVGALEEPLPQEPLFLRLSVPADERQKDTG
jgi:hypothetical protein